MFKNIFIVALLGSVSLAQADAVSVTVKRYADIAYQPQGSAPASVISLRDSTLAARIPSWVKKVHIHAGQQVNAGDTLISLDCSQAQALLTQQQAAMKSNAARLALAQYQLKRARSLRKKNHVSEEVLLQRQADVDVFTAEGKSLQAGLTSRQIDVDHCEVKAPYRGVVKQRQVDEAESVSVGQVLMQLVDNHKLEVVANIPAHAIRQNRFKNVDQFSLRSAGQSYELKLRTIVPVTDPQSRQQEVRFSFVAKALPNPGDSGRLVWRTQQRALPSDFLIKRAGAYGVFIVVDGKAVFSRVAHAEEGRPVYITLPMDTQLIVNGRQVVNDGDAVNIVH